MFQNDLINLFESFGVSKNEEYYKLPPGVRPYFLGRLYKAFTQNTDEAIMSAKNSGGVKFHFQSTGNLNDINHNVPNKAFLKKASFYANQTFITFPFKEISDRKQLRLLQEKPQHAWPNAHQAMKKQMYFGEITSGTRTPIGGTVGITGKVYSIDVGAFDDLLTTFFTLKPAIKAGIAQILPVFPDEVARFKDKRLGLTCANFSLPELQNQFYETDLLSATRRPSGLSHLLLPHFTNVPLERVLEIRDQEADLYWEFQRRFERLLVGASRVESETIILNFLRDVDLGVRELHRKFKDIEVTYKRKNIYMLLKFMSIGLTFLAPVEPEVRKAIAAVVGGISSFDYLTTKEDKAKNLYETRGTQFYLPWLIFKGSSDVVE